MSEKSMLDTIHHFRLVQHYINTIVEHLLLRSELHDTSKLQEPELSGYAGLAEAVNGLKYGTEEHRAAFAPFKEVIAHHYAVNDHHPEYFGGDVSQMNLLQLAEMLCDWKAASRRSDPSVLPSLGESLKRFNIEPQLASIIQNTVSTLDW